MSDHSESPVIVERRGAIALVTLNRPDRLNAVSLPLYRALSAALRELVDEGTTRVVVLTGQGRAFCVGADLKAHGEGPLSDAERREYAAAAQAAARGLQTLPLPVVAAVNGPAIGAGLEVALSCDLVVVAHDAKLRLPEAVLGTFVGGGVTYTLPARVGELRAREILFLGDFFSGDDAAEWGLANRAVDAAEVLPTAIGMAERLLERGPTSLRLLKSILDRARSARAEEILDAEAEALVECMGTEDWAEGIAAFHERRPPRFHGR